MCEITSSLFCVYLRHLRRYIRENARFDIITDSNILDFMDDDFNNSFIKMFFNEGDKTIEKVASELYEEYEKAKSNYETPRNIFGMAVGYYREISAIKNMLRLIKYSCTILEESQKSQAIFFCASVYPVFKNDNSINPTNWVYISAKQFEAKLTCTFYTDMCLKPLCPVTNYRCKDIFEIFNSAKDRPLLVLDEASYQKSIFTLINKHIKCEDSKDSLHLYRRGNSRSLYLDISDNSFDKPYSKSLEGLYNKLKELFENNRKLFNGCSMVLAIEYFPSKAYGVVIIFKIFIFQKVKDVGYVLNCCLMNKISDDLLKSVFYTKMISKEIIQGILDICYEYFKNVLNQEALDKICDDKELDFINGVKSTNSVANKEYRLVQSLRDSFKKGDYKPQVPNFIIYP